MSRQVVQLGVSMFVISGRRPCFEKRLVVVRADKLGQKVTGHVVTGDLPFVGLLVEQRSYRTHDAHGACASPEPHLLPSDHPST